MEKKAGEVYRIIRNKTGKCYVGQTTRTAAERFEEHRRCKTSYIGRAIRHYGVKAFTLEVLEVCETLEQLKERERYFIAKFDCRWPKGYNMTDGGEGIWDRTPESIKKMSRKGMHHTEETKRKLSRILKGRKISEETKRKISKALTGRRPTPEALKNMSKAAKARKGKKLSREHRHKISETLKRRHRGDSERPAIEVTAEARRKMSVAKLGIPLSDEHKATLSASVQTKKPVVCIETGTIYESITEAARCLKSKHSNIKRACQFPTRTAGGYHWRFKDEQPTEPQSSAMTPAGTRTPKHPVVCVETNEVFESISAAARRKNLRVTNISRACQMLNRTAGGFHWRYKDEPTT